MAKIIGYDKRELKKYKGICPKCGAIVIFDEDELISQYQYNEYCCSRGTCPGCGCDVSLDKNKDQYESTEELYDWPDATNCLKNCKKCQVRCLYRKEQFQDEQDETQNTQPIKYEALIEDYHSHLSRVSFEANSDKEAKEIAYRDWHFGMCGDNDRLWRVEGEYVNHSNFTDAERLKMEKNYIRIA